MLRMATDVHTGCHQVIPIVHIPGFGDRAAEKVCTDLKIASQNDAKKLAEAKNMVYLKGFTEGVMLVGPHAGKKVRRGIGAAYGPAIQFKTLNPYTLKTIASAGDATVRMPGLADRRLLQASCVKTIGS